MGLNKLNLLKPMLRSSLNKPLLLLITSYKNCSKLYKTSFYMYYIKLVIQLVQYRPTPIDHMYDC